MTYTFFRLKNELEKIEEWLRKEYSQIRTGQASPIILDGLQIDSYGSQVPIKNIASIIIEDPKTLRISPWDKQQVKNIEKAITVSNLGLSVSVDNLGIRVIFPQLTTETRTNLIKILKDKLEEARVSVRRERDQAWGDIQQKEKNKEIVEDDKFSFKKELQEEIDLMNKKLEETFKKKESDIMN